MNDYLVLGSSPAGMEPAAFARLCERLLLHLGFTDVSNVDGSGDGGADLVAMQGDTRWVFQVKSKTTSSVGPEAVDELMRGLQKFGGERGAVITNRGYSTAAVQRAEELGRLTQQSYGLWGREQLMRLVSSDRFSERFSSPSLRPYQVDAFQAAQSDLQETDRALLVLATGLGKTVIAGTVIDWFLSEHVGSQVLVLVHTKDLVDQLERALWQHLPSSAATQQIHSASKPERLDGVTVATIQSGVKYLREGFRPDLIFVDEAHHVSEDGQYQEAFGICPEALRLGATATPWRGDRFDIAEAFGDASYQIGIEEGMRLGYLADVKYRLYIDNIDWDYVASLSANSYSIAELNRRLFMPQRDERIRDEMLDVWYDTVSPRAIVFCQTIPHAEALLEVLRGVPVWREAAPIHDGLTRREQKTNLARFRLGDVPILVAVDMLNEGVDVPDVNIVCFARVTHSRKVFVQQLGRGLRLSPGKTHVTVLDFVSDLKRVKAALDLRAQVQGDSEVLHLPSSHSITFNDVKAESLLTEWVMDAADLDTPADEVRLNFPPIEAV